MTKDERSRIESILGGLDMFDEESDRKLIDDVAIDAVRDAAEIDSRLEHPDAQGEDEDEQSEHPRHALPVSFDSSLTDVDPDTIVDASMVHDEAGLRACCEKLRAALRAETIRRRNAEAEVQQLRGEVAKLRRYVGRQSLEIESKK